jgi:3-isopropylmalate/(R)-2-methylmalate dehydratase small subunit
MEEFKTHRGLVLPLDRASVDTDQIVPKQFLKRVGRTGYEDALFYDWRFNPDGTPKPDFVLNDPKYVKSTILLARDDFGCGSSREHATWALQDYGFKVIIAPSFADIFYNNCFNIGLLPITLPHEDIDLLFKWAKDESRGLRVTVNLDMCQVRNDLGDFVRTFELDEFRKESLQKGLDSIGRTLDKSDYISAYEEKLPSYMVPKNCFVVTP